MVMVVTVTLLTATLSALTGAFTQNARSEAVGRRVSRALVLADISEKEAADIMGLTRQRLNEALHGKSPLSIHRLAELPERFHEEYDRLGVESRGGVVVSPRLLEMLQGVPCVVLKAQINPFSAKVAS
jgi:transcriptional regulator with XRE-family HTH domain